MKCISYKAGYKYQLEADFSVLIDILPTEEVTTEYISLTIAGVLTIKEGYAWDGPSGPTVDTANFMRGALVHDALYQLMREGCLDHEKHREMADRILQSICLADGMSTIRAWYTYQAVHYFGDPSANPSHNKPILYAPVKC